jgi:hypothetical protein
MPAVMKSETRLTETLPPRMRADFIKCLTIIAKAALADENGARTKGRKRR